MNTTAFTSREYIADSIQNEYFLWGAIDGANAAKLLRDYGVSNVSHRDTGRNGEATGTDENGCSVSLSTNGFFTRD